MLAALECREPDYVPCCFSAFSILQQRCADEREFVDRQLAMGLDVVVEVGFPPVRHGPQVRTVETCEDSAGERYPVLRDATPASALRVGEKTPTGLGGHPALRHSPFPRAQALIALGDPWMLPAYWSADGRRRLTAGSNAVQSGAGCRTIS
jgi:hypothetical protein